MGLHVLYVVALCAVSACEDFDEKLRSGNVVVVCPSLEDPTLIKEKVCNKLAQLKDGFKAVDLSVIELPCCQALIGIVSEALRDLVGEESEKNVIPIYVRDVEPHLMEKVDAEL